jgi:peroxiredoxin
MANPIVDAIEQAFQEVRKRDTTLAERLQYVADRVRELSTVFADAIDTFVSRLETAGAGKDAPKIGEPMPGFLLPDDDGRLLSLDTLLKTAPVVINFYRGYWCPHCRLNAVGLAEIEDEIRPAQIVAISAQTQEFARRIKAESGAHFPFLTDFANGYALSLNLAIWVDDAMSSLIAGAGWDIPSYQGTSGWILPIPSVFVVGQDGLIKARHVDADYRRRMEPAEMSKAALAAMR